jgi:hypothetical protein
LGLKSVDINMLLKLNPCAALSKVARHLGMCWRSQAAALF